MESGKGGQSQRKWGIKGENQLNLIFYTHSSTPKLWISTTLVAK